MSILNVEHLTHGFGDRAIFDDVSFRLLKGEHIGLVGANGEGKSTFMSIVTGKLTPDEGKVEWAKNVRIPWGIKVNRVELKNIIPPAAIQDAMEKQMKAERERREAILRAEGEKKSTVLVAEGEKESVILKAEAEKQAAILQAEAEKEKRIKEAEGEAEAILKVQQANADGIRFIREAGADQAVLTIKSLEAFEKAADGKATKIIIPSELQSLAGLVKSAKEVIKED